MNNKGIFRFNKISWNNHPILGNLTIDFTKDDYSAFDTIVLVGENGAGKTTIIESIFNSWANEDFEWFKYIEFSIDTIKYRISPIFTEYEDEYWGYKCKEIATNEIVYEACAHGVSIFGLDLSPYALAYFKTRSDLSITRDNSFHDRRNIDEFNYIDENTGEHVYREAKKLDFCFITDEAFNMNYLNQYLIELSDEDDWLLVESIKSGSFTTLDEFEKKKSKIWKFKNAFNEFFDDIEFIGVNQKHFCPTEKKNVTFLKWGKEIQVENLSTGEQQVVFRGTILLKNSYALNGGVILIDEPELSMHPKWEMRILNYYKELMDKDGNQTSQFFFATHSEHVLQSALNDRKNTLLIVIKDGKNGVEARRVELPYVLDQITSAELNYFVFDILSTEYHDQLFSLLQVKTNNYKVKDIDTYICNTSYYNANIAIFAKRSSHNSTTYYTLPVYIRNVIHHPDNGNTYTEDEFRNSIQLLLELLRDLSI